MSAAECSTVGPRDVVRGLVVLAGFLMVVVGLGVTVATFTVNGWTVIAAVGVVVIAVGQKCPHGLVERGRCFYCTTALCDTDGCAVATCPAHGDSCDKSGMDWDCDPDVYDEVSRREVS